MRSNEQGKILTPQIINSASQYITFIAIKHMLLRGLKLSLISLWLKLLLISIPAFSATQNPKVASLNILPEKISTDTSRFVEYMALGQAWESKNFDSALRYYERALSISEINNWPDEKAKALINIGFAYFYSLNSNKSIDYLEQGLDIYTKINNKKGQLDTYYNLGTFYGYFEDYIKSIENYNMAARLGLEINDENRLGMIYNNLGLMFQYSGNYDKANLYQFKALAMKEKIGDTTIDITHLNIGLNYLQQQNFEKSLEYYKYALDLFIQKNNRPDIAHCHKNIGDVFLEMGELDAATESYQKAYSIYGELNDQESMARHFMVMGNIYRKQNLYSKADEAYQTALNLFPENGSKRLLFYINKNYAELFLELASENPNGNIQYLNKVISFGEKMSEIAETSGSIALQNESYEILYNAHKAMGNRSKAIEYADKFMASKDLLFSEQKQKTIVNIQTKYETEKKELEIDFLNNENDLITTSLSQSNTIRQNQRIIIYLLVAGFILVLVSILVIYRFYRLTKSANARLNEQNLIISRQKNEIEILLKEVHHRVKNNLQIITSLLDLQLMGIDNPETKATLLDAQSRLKSIALIHQVLSQSEKGKNVSFNNFVVELAGHIKNSVHGEKPITVDVDIPDTIRFNINTSIPLGLILNELLTNAFKYAFAEKESGRIAINLTTKPDGKYCMEVIDNGCGLPIGFDIRTSTSLGLSLISTLSGQLSGKINYEYLHGAKFTLLFLEAKS